MGHYRDKGYGMGYRTGYISGLRGDRRELLASGVTFPDDAANAARWKRWYRLLLTDMWGIFFVGAMLGMLLPTILMAQAVNLSGEKSTTATARLRGHCTRTRVRPGDAPACCGRRADPFSTQLASSREQVVTDAPTLRVAVVRFEATTLVLIPVHAPVGRSSPSFAPARRSAWRSTRIRPTAR
jgi:hypothetical protein